MASTTVANRSIQPHLLYFFLECATILRHFWLIFGSIFLLVSWSWWSLHPSSLRIEEPLASPSFPSRRKAKRPVWFWTFCERSKLKVALGVAQTEGQHFRKRWWKVNTWPGDANTASASPVKQYPHRQLSGLEFAWPEAVTRQASISRSEAALLQSLGHFQSMYVYHYFFEEKQALNLVLIYLQKSVLQLENEWTSSQERHAAQTTPTLQLDHDPAEPVRETILKVGYRKRLPNLCDFVPSCENLLKNQASEREHWCS